MTPGADRDKKKRSMLCEGAEAVAKGVCLCGVCLGVLGVSFFIYEVTAGASGFNTFPFLIGGFPCFFFFFKNK
jgi:hypothetical protein